MPWCTHLHAVLQAPPPPPPSPPPSPPPPLSVSLSLSLCVCVCVCCPAAPEEFHRFSWSVVVSRFPTRVYAHALTCVCMCGLSVCPLKNFRCDSSAFSLPTSRTSFRVDRLFVTASQCLREPILSIALWFCKQAKSLRCYVHHCHMCTGRQKQSKNCTLILWYDISSNSGSLTLH